MAGATAGESRTFVWGSGASRVRSSPDALARPSSRIADVVVGGAGQLGLGNRDDFALPQALATNELVSETITTGGCHSAGWSGRGELYMWGDNEKLQLAKPREEACLVAPTRLLELEGYQVEAVACGWSHTVVAASEKGGNDESQQIVLTWGAHEHHQLGRVVSTEQPTNAPLAVPLPSLSRRLRVLSISSGWKHSQLVLDDGSVYSWGSGRHGELALGGSRLTAPEPTLVASLADASIDRVYCGWQHSVFFSSHAGTVYTCGNNRHGQLGVPNTTEVSRFLPEQVTTASGAPIHASQVAVGWHFAVCLSVEGALFSWGKGTHGQLGLGSFDTVQVPTNIAFADPVASLACGSEHTMVVTQQGDLFTCGWGEHGNLGHGDTENRSSLTKVQFFALNDWRVVSATAGGAVSIVHVLGRSADGQSTDVDLHSTF